MLFFDFTHYYIYRCLTPENEKIVQHEKCRAECENKEIYIVVYYPVHFVGQERPAQYSAENDKIRGDKRTVEPNGFDGERKPLVYFKLLLQGVGKGVQSEKHNKRNQVPKARRRAEYEC